MAKAKIDDEIMLELANRGLSSSEIARYFSVTPAAVRAKALTLSRKHPGIIDLASRSKARANQPIGTRLSLDLDRYMTESSQVQRSLARIPIEDDLDHLDKRNSLIIKGLTILEKIQKLQEPSTREPTRTLQVGQITQIINGNRPATTPEESTQTIEA